MRGGSGLHWKRQIGLDWIVFSSFKARPNSIGKVGPMCQVISENCKLLNWKMAFDRTCCVLLLLLVVFMILFTSKLIHSFWLANPNPNNNNNNKNKNNPSPPPPSESAHCYRKTNTVGNVTELWLIFTIQND